jgi:MFS family permease
MITVI